MSNTPSFSKYIQLYITALMDVTKLPDEEYHIILVKGSSKKPPAKKYSSRSQARFDITPERARKILNIIHDSLGDYSYNVLVPLDFVTKKIKSFDDLKKFTLEKNGAWNFFPYKTLFKPEEDFGFDPFAFNNVVFIDELNKQIDLVEFLEPKVVEDDKDDQE